MRIAKAVRERRKKGDNLVFVMCYKVDVFCVAKLTIMTQLRSSKMRS